MSIAETLFSFEGRTRRSVYWVITIPLILGQAYLAYLTSSRFNPSYNEGLAVLSIFLSIPVIWIGLANTIKRWHDINMSGWMTLTLFIPLVNFLIVLFLGLMPGTKGANKYGNDPRGRSTKAPIEQPNKPVTPDKPA